MPLAVRQRLFDWGPYGYRGRYDDWAAAVRASIGYQSPVVLEKTRQATARVRAGQAAYQQDGVALPELPEHGYRIALIAASAALERGGRLRVVDFGGALGGTYFGCRTFLGPHGDISWTVVEQATYCECGRREFADQQLSFSEGIEAAMAQGRPDVIICSSVLQFLEQPLSVLRQLFDLGARHLVVDRTPFSASGNAEITVQRVPPGLYRASFPSWLLSEREFLHTAAASGYHVWRHWDFQSAFTARATFKGFVFRPKC